MTSANLLSLYEENRNQKTEKNLQLWPKVRLSARSWARSICHIFHSAVGSVLVNSDATVESLNSMPSIQARGHFRNVFVKPLEIFEFLVIFAPSKAHKGKFLRKFVS